MVLLVQVMVWDLEAGGQLAEVTCGEYLNAVCWSPDQAWDQWKAAQNYIGNIKFTVKKTFFLLSSNGFYGQDVIYAGGKKGAVVKIVKT
jgi:hypothetical protein